MDKVYALSYTSANFLFCKVLLLQDWERSMKFSALFWLLPVKQQPLKTLWSIHSSDEF